MLKKTYLTIILFIFSLTLFGQTNNEIITGTVETADGKPAEYINVVLKNTYYGTLTDENGNFRLEAPAGEYTMAVYSIWDHRKEFPVTIKAGASNHFPGIAVIENALQLEQVVVTGQFYPQSLSRSVFRTRVITADQIEQKASTSVESLLNTEVGIRIYNDMALGETQFEVMGMSGNNVKVLIDGIPIVERSGNQQILSQIDINTIERVEIVEGPMSVTYGTDALAGVINIITKKGKPKSGKKLSVTARLQEETIGKEYGFMTGKGFHTQSATVGYAFDNGFYVAANFTRNEFGGWRGNRVQRAGEWPSKEQYMAGGQIGFSKRKYSLQYKFDYLHEEILKKGDVSAINKAVDERFLANRFTHQLQADWSIGNRIELNFAASYQNYQRDKRSTVIDIVTGEKTPSTASDANDDTEYSVWFGRAVVLWRTLHNLNLMAGLEYQRDMGKGDKVSDEATAINNAAIFLSAEYTPVEWLKIRPGVRSTYNSKYKAPWAIPSLNLKFALTETMDLRLSYAKGFRSPRLQELYYEFYHTNGGGFWIRGNRDLKAEKSDSYMASYVWRPLHNERVRLTTTLSGFYNDYRNQIRLVTFDGSSMDQMYHNVDKYRTIGLTFENALVLDKLTAEAAFSYIGRYNRLYDDEDFASEKQDKMRYSPEVSASVSYRWTKVATFSLFYKYTGKRSEYTVYSETGSDETLLMLGERAGYHWVDLTVSRPIIKMIRITAGVRNLFNVIRVDNTILEAGHGVPLSSGNNLISYGRSYFIGLTFNLNT